MKKVIILLAFVMCACNAEEQNIIRDLQQQNHESDMTIRTLQNEISDLNRQMTNVARVLQNLEKVKPKKPACVTFDDGRRVCDESNQISYKCLIGGLVVDC